jgi:hypothetical protein
MSDAERAPELEQAARDVEQRRLELSRSLQQVEARGEHMAQELGQKLKPVLIGVALAAGALAVVAGVALLARRRRSAWLPPAKPSALRTLARNAGFALLRLAARHAARALTERLAAPSPDPALAEPGPAQ